MADDEKSDLIRAYKAVLREALQARPSGIRLRIADAIGKNKSFVSQITNPGYKTPLPEKYVEPILAVVQLAGEERERFLQVYRRAHPLAGELPADWQDNGTTRVLRLELPKLGSRALESKVDALLVDFAHRVSDLVGAER